MRSSVHSAATVIRHARADDAAKVAALLTELGYPCDAPTAEKQIRSHLIAVSSSVFVAEYDGRVVALASFQQIPLFHTEGLLGRITSFIVTASHRKLGIGRSLAAAVERFAWAHGCERIEVTSGSQRSGAHDFYEQLGYKPTSRRFIKTKPQ